LNHFTVPDFWEAYENLPNSIQKLADKNFEILKDNPFHPSLHFKKAGKFWSARVGIKYRALAIEINEGFLWFWIGDHKAYDKLID
jgi:hypothetical protein